MEVYVVGNTLSVFNRHGTKIVFDRFATNVLARAVAEQIVRNGQVVRFVVR